MAVAVPAIHLHRADPTVAENTCIGQDLAGRVKEARQYRIAAPSLAMRTLTKGRTIQTGRPAHPEMIGVRLLPLIVVVVGL